MTFFLTGVMKMGYSEDEIFAVLHESERDQKRRRVFAKAIETVAAHRLQQMNNLLALDKLTTWRRMNGFDRVVDSEGNWFHGPHSLPPTPQEFAASLWCEVNALKDAISMPARTTSWQKIMEFVDGLQGKLPDEELAVIKRYVEKRSLEAAQMTVTPVDTVQYCSSRPLNPELPSDVHAKMEEKDEGWMNPELKELEPPSAGTGFEIPGQQCHPIWETVRTTADGFLTAGMGSNLGKHTSPKTERAGARAGSKTSTTTADISSPTEHVGTRAGTAATPAKRRHKITSEENKQFDPGGKGETAPLWNAAVILSFVSWGERWAMGGSLLVLRDFLSVCVFLLCFLFILTVR